ncbi:PLP-dependent aminotransferase family protein [Actinocrispum wychmicini]|uniref:aminotransferase-like domain-containing protein n=1 Tax=Actinocrispum wychmicini TaxID=1213861 RepID=UPI0014048285|nr:PLP-dependent aminotransferase family protein [Actinocrispum wychmicini]
MLADRSLSSYDVALVKNAAEPLYAQLYTQLRAAIVAGDRRIAGARLPSSRELAGEFGVSRNTVVLAYQRLQEDGFVRGMAGGGTVVADLPPLACDPPAPEPVVAAVPATVERAPYGLPNSAFPVGVPPVDLFPTALWAGLTSRRLRASGVRVLLGSGRLGYRPLREAIAGYLWVVRGIRCSPDQVIVTRGLGAGLDLLGRALLRAGDRVWCEEPGYYPGWDALARHGVRRDPVPVDTDGLDVAAGRAMAPEAAMALVSAACQMPLSVTMTAQRRTQLLDHARGTGMWIVEHESDTPFLGRHASRPLVADDPDGRVIHVGSFDTVLFPQLHVGYCVVPVGLIDPVGRVLCESGAQASGLTQAVLSDFLNHHRFARFMMRITSACTSRRDALRDALLRLPGTPLAMIGDGGRGACLTALFSRDVREDALLADAARLSLRLEPLSRYFSTPAPATAGLLLGCAAAREEAIGPAVRLLAGLLRRHGS